MLVGKVPKSVAILRTLLYRFNPLHWEGPMILRRFCFLPWCVLLIGPSLEALVRFYAYTHRIHGTGLVTHMPLLFMTNAGKYKHQSMTNFMLFSNLSSSIPPPHTPAKLIDGEFPVGMTTSQKPWTHRMSPEHWSKPGHLLWIGDFTTTHSFIGDHSKSYCKDPHSTNTNTK